MTHTQAKLFAKCGAYHTPDSHPLFTYNVTVTDDGRPLVTVHGTTEFEAVEYAQTLADRCNGYEALKAENERLRKTLNASDNYQDFCNLKSQRDELATALEIAVQNLEARDSKFSSDTIKMCREALKNAGAL